MKARVFLCKHCGHVLTMPRPGMTWKEAKSWFKYMTCPACKQPLQVIEQVPEPVIPTHIQALLWTGEDRHATH